MLRNLYGKQACQRLLLLAFMVILSVFASYVIGVKAMATPQNIEPIAVHSWSEQVFVQAKRENKLVLLDITATWCQFCKKMKAVTYQDGTVVDTINDKYILVRVDETELQSLAINYQDDGRPTTVIFNTKGEELIKRVGYIKPQWMNWMLLAVAQDPLVNLHQ